TVQHVGHWRGGGPRRRGSQEDLANQLYEESNSKERSGGRPGEGRTLSRRNSICTTAPAARRGGTDLSAKSGFEASQSPPRHSRESARRRRSSTGAGGAYPDTASSP
ncbi:unnamed protein product, partial [Amoebophrya sp. A25]